MKISYNWLKTHIDIDDTPTKVAAILTDIGLEVEGIESFESIKGGLKGVVVGEVIECKQHPNADNLKLTKVNINTDDAVQIICGAPNIALGQKVAVAKLGCTLYDTKGMPFVIKKTKIRGVLSEGMICSSKELHLGDDHSGILVLDDQVLVGESISTIYNVENDSLFDIGLTPNRSDAMSHYGVARDLASWYVFHTNKRCLIEAPIPKIDTHEHQPISIEIHNPELCNRYCGVSLVDVKVKESPQWLKDRLKSMGIIPKNNVVDITNFMLHDLGQPLHAFDASKIIGEKVVVKTLNNSTDFMGLDNKTYQLLDSDLMICDAEKPLCIAGVFGGMDSGVTEKSTSVFLESAYFNPVSIRKTSKRLGLNTDASFRFERGIDPKDTKRALLSAISLMQELTGCKVMAINDLYPNVVEDARVTISLSFINKISGHTFSEIVIEKIFDALNFNVLEKDKNAEYTILIPTYRPEVNAKEDVLEEILRIFGYNNIQEQTKIQFTPNIFVQKAAYKIQNVIGDILISMGFYEVMNNSMTSVLNLNQNITDRKDVVKVLNPLSNELNEMRTSLLFSGLSSVSHNLRRKYKSIRFFEFGKTYHKLESYDEQNHLAMFTCGIRNTSDWTTEVSSANFYDIKGVVEVILNRMGIDTSEAMVDEHPIFEYALEYMTVNKTKPKLLVSVGVVKKTILNQYDIDQEVYFADINWDVLLFECEQTASLKIAPIVKYPAVQRDFSILINHDISFNDIKLKIQNINPKYLIAINLFDVYEGKNLPKGKKSYGLRFKFQSTKKTLNEKEVSKQLGRIEQELITSLEATIRDH